MPDFTVHYGFKVLDNKMYVPRSSKTTRVQQIIEFRHWFMKTQMETPKRLTVPPEFFDELKIEIAQDINTPLGSLYNSNELIFMGMTIYPSTPSTQSQQTLLPLSLRSSQHQAVLTTGSLS